MLLSFAIHAIFFITLVQNRWVFIAHRGLQWGSFMGEWTFSSFVTCCDIVLHANYFLGCKTRLQEYLNVTEWHGCIRVCCLMHYDINSIFFLCLLLLISMLWHRQAIFESKGDRLSSCTESRFRTLSLRHQFASRLNACWQTDWAVEDQTKNLNSIARPYDQQPFSPLDLTASWLSHLALAIYMFVVVNFDALSQASDIRIERRHVVFLCWMQDSNPRSQTPIRQQTVCLLTNRLSYRGSS